MNNTTPKTVLLVEDDARHAELICHSFATEADDFVVSLARSVGEAREILAGGLPDLLVVDLGLPDGRGTELLRSTDDELSCPAIVLTSQGDEKAAVEAMKAGALDYLVKSTDIIAQIPHVARRALREWENIMERRRIERALREAHEQLEQRVASRTAELTHANEYLREEIERRKRAERQNRRLLEANERERKLIAFEIHDGLAQQLTGASMQLQAFEQFRPGSADATKALASGQSLLADGIAEARRLISGLRPVVLEEAGVVAAIENLVAEVRARGNVEIELDVSVAFDRLESLLENAIFRVVQEGLANACRHSQTDKVRIAVIQADDCVQVEIRDWGGGFDERVVPKRRFGIQGMRERTRVLGGRFTLESHADEGTRILAEFPLTDP